MTDQGERGNNNQSLLRFANPGQTRVANPGQSALLKLGSECTFETRVRVHFRNPGQSALSQFQNFPTPYADTFLQTMHGIQRTIDRTSPRRCLHAP